MENLDAKVQKLIFIAHSSMINHKADKKQEDMQDEVIKAKATLAKLETLKQPQVEEIELEEDTFIESEEEESTYFIEDSVKAYLKEIGSIPLLDKDQEINLFSRIEAGDETAKVKVINANLRLVISVV